MHENSSLDQHIKRELSLIEQLHYRKNTFKTTMDHELAELMQQYGVPTDSSRPGTQNSIAFSGISQKIDSFANYLQSQFGAKTQQKLVDKKHKSKQHNVKIVPRKPKIASSSSESINQSISVEDIGLDIKEPCIKNTAKTKQQRKAQLQLMRHQVRSSLLQQKTKFVRPTEPANRPKQTQCWRVHTETRIASLNCRYPRNYLPHRQLNNIRKNRQALESLKNSISAFLNESRM